jgi:hypothetical protein
VTPTEYRRSARADSGIGLSSSVFGEPPRA